MVCPRPGNMSANLEGCRFFIKTFGCQMNENDSEHIAGLLVRAGAAKAFLAEESDIILVNTCAVRKKSEDKIDSFLGRLSPLKKDRGRVIGVLGCVAQLRRGALFKKRPEIDFIIGPDHYHELASLLSQKGEGKLLKTSWNRAWHEIGSAETLRESRVSAYVPIMEGCDNFCAYCVVPFSRGREKCRPMDSVLAEVLDLAGNGYKEVQLLGQNVNSYRDPGTGEDFAGLLRKVSRVEGIEWIRFITSHPKDLSPEIARTMADRPSICRHLHLPLQSGSTSVLARMNRGYTREEYLEKAALLKGLMPDIALSTDIIVGFPGETEADFEETLDALKKVEFANIFSFRYSPRPRTAAARTEDDVPLDVKRKRLIILQELQKDIQLARNRTLIGKTFKVLCFGESKKGAGRYSGRNEGFQVVNFGSPRDVRDRFIDVLITGCGPYSLHGKTLNRLDK
jgi:tRNA-2-methylthio-N6-dimethylallyladenosine synthase